MSEVIELTDATFEQSVLEAGVPVLVDFWAPWCGPCRAVAPTIEALAAEYEGRAKVAKVNVDEQQGVAGALRVQSIPTVIVFDGRNVVAAQVGALPASQYRQMLDQALTARAG
ncbi:MAG: thioredoxin [Candidatus Lambdaproteobacteria bacterium]|nr:thioredoxin [Candidatus Lambdaproteobacteria bacterium]